jgi:hypothetical protein
MIHPGESKPREYFHLQSPDDHDPLELADS